MFQSLNSREYRCLFGVVLFFVIINGFSGVGLAKKDETITFRFNPEHNSEFTQTVSEKKIKRFEGFGSQEDLSRSTYVFNIQYNEPLWDFNVSLGDVSMFRDGEVFVHPLIQAMKDTLITYKVNAQGQAVEIEGFDIVTSKALSQLPPDIQAGMASVFNPEVLSEAALIEYNARVGDFVGATVSIGDVWEWQVPMTLANGVSLDYVGKTQFTKWTDFNGVKVLQIDIHYNSQVDELGNLIEPILSSMTDDDDVLSIADGSAGIKGTVHRLIDPETMSIYYEKSSRVITMQMPVPNMGDVPMVMKEEKVFEYAY